MKSWIKRLSPRRPSRAAPGTPSSPNQTEAPRSAEDARAAGDAARDRRAWAEAHLREQDDAAIWVQLGHARKEAGGIADARIAYERAIALEPNSADAHLQLGHALKLQGLLDEALRSYTAARSLDPTSIAAAREVESIERFDGQSMPHKGSGTASEAQTSAGHSNLSEGAMADASQMVRDLLARHYIDPALIEQSDPEFYSYTQRLKPSSAEARLLEALTHFCELGFHVFAPIADGLVFSHSFYIHTYGDNFPMSEADAYRRWLNLGLATGQAPNFAAWLRQAQGLDLDDLWPIDFALYREMNPSLRAV